MELIESTEKPNFSDRKVADIPTRIGETVSGMEILENADEGAKTFFYEPHFYTQNEDEKWIPTPNNVSTGKYLGEVKALNDRETTTIKDGQSINKPIHKMHDYEQREEFCKVPFDEQYVTKVTGHQGQCIVGRVTETNLEGKPTRLNAAGTIYVINSMNEWEVAYPRFLSRPDR